MKKEARLAILLLMESSVSIQARTLDIEIDLYN